MTEPLTSPDPHAALKAMLRHLLQLFARQEDGVHLGENWFTRADVQRELDRLNGDLEVCICAAHRLNDGRIVRGHRHDDCIHTIQKWKAAGQDVGTITMVQQGFLTSRGRFVDRKEGYDLQVAAGLFKDRQGVQILVSEDLY